MFGLSDSHYNIVKKQAKDCAERIKEQIQTGTKYDHCAAAIIMAHHSPVQVLVSYTQFVWLCGYLQGRYGNGRFDYE